MPDWFVEFSNVRTEEPQLPFACADHHAFDHLRFRRALQMLTDTDTKLATVSDACGFSEVAAFSRAFKNKFGAPPSNFRG